MITVIPMPTQPNVPVAGELGRGAITLHVDGTLGQPSDLSQLIWKVAETIEHFSSAWALAPGGRVSPVRQPAWLPGRLAT